MNPIVQRRGRFCGKHLSHFCFAKDTLYLLDIFLALFLQNTILNSNVHQTHHRIQCVFLKKNMHQDKALQVGEKQEILHKS